MRKTLLRKLSAAALCICMAASLGVAGEAKAAPSLLETPGVRAGDSGWNTPFRLNEDGVLDFIIINTDDKTAYRTPWSPTIQRVVDLLRVVEREPYDSRPVIPADTDYGKPLSHPGQMAAIGLDGSRIVYGFNERSITASGQDAAGKLLFNACTRITQAETYNYFLKYLKKQEYGVFPAWLSVINPSRVKSVKVEAADGRTRTIKPADEDFEQAVSAVTFWPVEPDSLRTSAVGEAWGGCTAAIEFTTGVTYEVRYAADKIQIASSDMTYRCFYRTKPEEHYEAIFERLLPK